jgi:glycosyltransferase involved in cell wall biosynthesis
MRIVVTGTRGIPNILGGVETHCQELYPRIVKSGHEVILVRRKPYVHESPVLKEYQGVKLKDIWAPRQKSLEAIVHTFIAILYAKKIKANLLHIHAIGPGIMIPFARLLGMKVIMTNHGPDYNRQKWNKLAKAMLRLGEYLGARFSNKVIVISTVIDQIVKKKYSKASTELIYNGVNISPIPDSDNILKEFGLEAKKYIVAVGRFVPEKGFHDLLEVFKQLDTKVKLVFIGDADHFSSYSEELKANAKGAGVVLTGFQKGNNLKVLFGNAKLFVLPSYHEGLPIALLEAMSFGLNVLVSDIPANLIVGLNKTEYFKTGDIDDLYLKIRAKLDDVNYTNYDYMIKDKYNWNKISEETLCVYQKVIQ